MQIQVNAPHENLPDSFVALTEKSLEDSLAPHAERLTRIEVHFKDLNGSKGGVDKRCLIEARPRGMDPMAAEHEGVNVQEAFKGALEKIQRVLKSRFGKLDARQGK